MNINQTLNGFRGYIGDNGGILHLNRFLVNIPTVQALKENISSHKNVQRGLQFSARAATLPSKTISTNAVLAAGPEQKYPYEDVYDDLTVTFITTKGKDKHLPERLFFEDWIDTVVNPNSMLIGFSKEYAVDLTLSVLSDKRSGQTKVAEYIFKRTYPVGISSLEFAHDAEAIMTFKVTFSYDKWYREEETKIAESKNPSTKERSNKPDKSESIERKAQVSIPHEPPKIEDRKPISSKIKDESKSIERKAQDSKPDKSKSPNRKPVGSPVKVSPSKSFGQKILGKIQNRVSAELGIRPIID